MATTTLNINVFNDFLVARRIMSSNINITADNSNIYMNVSTVVSGATNIGGDTNGFFANNAGGVLIFKNIAAGSFISLVSNNSRINVNADITTIVLGATNIGGDTNGTFGANIGGILNFKNLTQGSFITITSNNSQVRINATSTQIITGATNLGGDSGGPFSTNNGGTLNFKDIVGNSPITVSSNNSLISINSLTPSVGTGQQQCRAVGIINLTSMLTAYGAVNFNTLSFGNGVSIAPSTTITAPQVYTNTSGIMGISSRIPSTNPVSGTLNLEIGYTPTFGGGWTGSGCVCTIPFTNVVSSIAIPVTWSTSTFITPTSTSPWVIVVKAINNMSMISTGSVSFIVRVTF